MSIDPRHLELAAEFCKLAGKPNLLDYLGLKPETSPEEAQEALKKRRKYMQGMQANPKYKNEALLLIKHFSAFTALMNEPAAYYKEARKREESQHLPVLEMTIRGALRGGPLTPEQVDFLRRNATELGIGEDTFVGTLDKLVAEAGVVARPVTQPVQRQATPVNQDVPPVRTAAVQPAPPSRPQQLQTGTLDEVDITDHYQVLGVTRDANKAQLQEAYNDRLREAKRLARPEMERAIQRIEAAWSVLGESNVREAYDMGRHSTGPPARDRDNTDPGLAKPSLSSLQSAPTAPPVRQRTHTPPGGKKPDAAPAAAPRGNAVTLEIVGDAVRKIRASGPTTEKLRVRLEGDDSLSARVATDEPWLVVQPSRLEPGRRDYFLNAQIDPLGMKSDLGQATITVQTERGDRAAVTFEVERVQPSNAMWVGVVVVLVLLVVAAVVAAVFLGGIA
jgi:hypothetical protein